MGPRRGFIEGHRLTPPDAPSRRSLRIGLEHEATLDARDRRRGAHYTPYPTARAVVRLALGRHDARSPRILDPCCGGGVFLVAALDELVAGGLEPSEALGRVAGHDIDAGAVVATREALREWAGEHRIADGELWRAEGAVSVEDVLTPRWSPPVRPDIVVGNPPFAGRLLTETAAVVADAADGRGEGFGPYTDVSALVWVAAVGWTAESGVIAMILPRSVLGARDARPAREAVLRDADLCELWIPPKVFTGVEVVVPVLARGHAGLRLSGGVEVSTGSIPEPAGVLENDELTTGSWSAALALAAGVPQVAEGGTPLGGRIEATAGFRDLFYAIAPNVREGDPGPGVLRVASTGMVDPGVLRWGERPARIGGRRWVRPVVDPRTLEGVPAVRAWIDRQARPKLLVASQTRILEAAADLDGDTVALTPLVAAVPTSTDPDELWMVLAAICAPPAAAWAVSRAAGTGRSAAALRVSADLLRRLPTPPDALRWASAARSLARGATVPEVADGLTAAWGCDALVTEWWRSQLPAGMRDGSSGR